MIRQEITAQVRNIYLHVHVHDWSQLSVPAKALIDTGAEATFVHSEFAQRHLVGRGTVDTPTGPDLIYVSTNFFGNSFELGVPTIEFRQRPDVGLEKFTAVKTTPSGGEKRIDLDIIAGMDTLERLDFDYFHEGAATKRRSFLSIGRPSESRPKG